MNGMVKYEWEGEICQIIYTDFIFLSSVAAIQNATHLYSF